MSLSSGLGISSGGLNTGGNFTDSSFSLSHRLHGLTQIFALCGMGPPEKVYNLQLIVYCL